MIKGSTLVLVGVVFVVLVMMLCSCSGEGAEGSPRLSVHFDECEGEMNGPLSSFSQEITRSSPDIGEGEAV